MAEVNQHSSIAISAITEAEMLYGLALKPRAVRLRTAIEALLAAIQILPWDSEAARTYGRLRAQMTAAGKNLSNLDLCIAAHAIAIQAILVTRDAAFSQIEALHPMVNWATDVLGSVEESQS